MGINKMALSLAVAGVLGASSALAEQSGAFIGGGFGFHGASRKTNLNLNYNLIITNVNVKLREEDNAKDTSISLVAGYKNMDNEIQAQECISTMILTMSKSKKKAKKQS